MISADLLGDKAAINRLRSLYNSVNAALTREIAELGIALQSNVQQNKLSGQVLKPRSGALRSSIGVAVERNGSAVTATVFTDVDYAAVQEYGFSGTVNVRASLRQIKEAFGRPIGARTIDVGPHSRRMDLPEHSFLRSALAEMMPDIGGGVEDALREGLAR